MHVVPPIPGSAFDLLAERERGFRPPEPLRPLLEGVRDFLREELSEGSAEGMTLARAGLVTAAAGTDTVPPERLIPLAAGVEMIHHALTVQQTALRPDDGVDLFGILSQDLVLARALDLFTADGSPRVMEAVSRGAASLCEALMSERAGEPVSNAVKYLGGFHAACARVGIAAAGGDEAREKDAARRVKELFQFSFGTAKETPSPSENKQERPGGYLDGFLSRWLLPSES
jgi:hypothetical protein